MSQQNEPCQFTARAVVIATCAQHLSSRGYTIVGIDYLGKQPIIFIESAAHNKKLKPVGAGCTWHKGALFAVFQAEVKDVLVKWLEPSHIPMQLRKEVY